MTFLPCMMRRTEESGPSHAIRTAAAAARAPELTAACTAGGWAASARPRKPERRRDELTRWRWRWWLWMLLMPAAGGAGDIAAAAAAMPGTGSLLDWSRGMWDEHFTRLD